MLLSVSLTEREQQVVDLLRADPLVGSAAIAQALGATRGAVNVHLSNLARKGVVLGRGYVLAETPGVVVVGGANMDVKARCLAPTLTGTSNPGAAVVSPGGVGRNIAENLARLGTRTHLVARVGHDQLGEQLLAATSGAGVHVTHVTRSAQATGTYTAVLDHDGELVVAVADMAATDALAPEHVSAARDLLAGAALVVLDGNLAPATLAHALDLVATTGAGETGARVVLDPVSVAKAERVSPLVHEDRPLLAITPNAAELAALTGRRVGTEAELAAAVAALHERGVVHVWVRLGADGSLLSSPGGRTRLPVAPGPLPAGPVVDVTGAGDAMVAAFCHALLCGAAPADAAAYAHRVAALTVASPHTVRPDLTDSLARRLP